MTRHHREDHHEHRRPHQTHRLDPHCPPGYEFAHIGLLDANEVEWRGLRLLQEGE